MPQAPLLTPLVLHAIKYLDAAARHRSFTRAAEELHVTQGAVSQQIKGLEEQIGVRLFDRLPRGLALTAEGERLCRVVHRILRDLEAELQAIQPSAASKTLLIRSSPSFSMMWLMPRLSRFSRLHPDIEIRLRGELFGMSSARMQAEAIDILILYGQVSGRGDQKLTPLMKEYLLPVATPGYLSGHAPIAQAGDFAGHTLLHDDSPWEGAPAFEEWCSWLHAHADDLENSGRRGHQYNLSSLAVNAALQGQGIAMARAALVAEELERGQLLPVLPRCVRSSAHYALALNPGAADQGAIHVFKEWIVNECRAFEAQRDALLSTLGVARDGAA